MNQRRNKLQQIKKQKRDEFHKDHPGQSKYRDKHQEQKKGNFSKNSPYVVE